MVAGFLVASVYAVGMLRGRRDRLHRVGLAIPLAVASIATPFQIFVGDLAARGVADHQPAKFAATEYVTESGRNQPEHLGGVLVDGKVKGALSIPDMDSLLVGFSADTYVKGLDRIPDDREPPAPTLLHLSFDAMVGIAFALLALAAWSALAWWRRGALPEGRWYLRAVAASGVAAVLAMECGWIVTEVGRQPWVVYGHMRTEDAVTGADGVWVSFATVLVLYTVLGAAAVAVLRAMSRRWREEAAADLDVPYGPPPAP
jgi:cytochrome bd ubiquinol oxidase subunit I